MQSRFMQLNNQSQYRMTASVVIVSLGVALIGTNIHVSNSENVDLDSFAIGDCAEVHYTAPTKRATIKLKSAQGDIVLHTDYRVKYSSQVDTLLLNTRLAGESWNSSERLLVPGVKSTPGTTLKFVICPMVNHQFSISLNGKFLAIYSNSKIDITTVSRVHFANYGGDAKLQKICVNYTYSHHLTPYS